MEYGVTGFFIHGLHVGKELDSGSAVGIVFVRTLFELFFILMGIGIGLDISFLAQAQRTDDSEWHFPHFQLNRHRGEMTLKGEVQKGGMDDVVLMMAQSDLRTTQFLREIEELFATLPGAEKARGLLFAFTRRRTVRSSGGCQGLNKSLRMHHV